MKKLRKAALWLGWPVCLSLLFILSPAATGYLSAEPTSQVTAQAPAKGKLTSVKVSGSQKFPEEQIVAASGLRVGEIVTREDLQAAADRLAQLGPFANVRYHFTSKGEDVSAEYQLEDAPTVPVSFDNFPWFTDEELTAALRQAVALFDGTAPEQGTILDDMTAALNRLLAAHNVKAVVERALTGRPGEEGMMQQFRVAGTSLKISALRFTHDLANQERHIQERLTDVVGKPYSRFSLQIFCTEQVRPIYLERGHLRARFGLPDTRFAGDPNRPLPDNVVVTVPIEPGPVYRWGGVTWRGNTALDLEALTQILGFAADETANGMKTMAAWDRVRDEYGRIGHLDVKLDAEPAYDDAAQRVSYRVTVTEGPQYRMGELIITGLSVAAERKIITAWAIQHGQVFDRRYFDEFLATGIKKAFADYVVHYSEVGNWLRTNPEAKTVDVLLDFR